MEEQQHIIQKSKSISVSNKDVMVLDELMQNQQICQLSQPDNYQDMVVLKPWGHEFLVFRNDLVAIWFLHINRNHATSMHCHPTKQTSLVVLRGDALCNTFRNRNFVTKGNCLILKEGVFHCTKALSLSGINLLEIETPPDKLDLVRLSDGYGRSKHGYEGLSQMEMEDLSNYDYFSFTEDMFQGGSHFDKKNDYGIIVNNYDDAEKLLKDLKVNPRCSFCVCKGSINDINGNSLLGIGEVQPGHLFKNVSQLEINGEIQIMQFLFY